jgi:hypothetical protein
MFEEFNEAETEILLNRGFSIVEGEAKKSFHNSWETVKKIDRKIYHNGKDPYGKTFSLTYDNFNQWNQQQK